MLRVLSGCGALVVVLLATQAQASVLSGSFSGIAERSFINAPGLNPGNFDGSLVTGTFSLDLTSAAQPDAVFTSSFNGASTKDYLYFPTHSAVMSLTFNAAGMSATFGNESGAGVTLAATAAGLSVQLEPDVMFPLVSGRLTLAGPLFTNFDIATLAPGPVDLLLSTASFTAGRNFGATVRLTDVEFGTAVAAVSEPESDTALALSLAILVLGSLGEGWRSRVRRAFVRLTQPH